MFKNMHASIPEEMGTQTKWKKLVHDAETISYVKDLSEYRVIIEARQYDDGWEIVKKYLGGGLNFVETYNAQSTAELRRLLKQLRSEKDLSRNEIKDITKFKKRSLRVLVRRGWKEAEVEKWFFSIGDDFTNYICVRYGRDIDVDIVMEEQLKYIEEKIIDKLFDVLGLREENRSINQSVYYYTKKTNFFIDQEDSEFDFQFVME